MPGERKSNNEGKKKASLSPKAKEGAKREKKGDSCFGLQVQQQCMRLKAGLRMKKGLRVFKKPSR